MHFVKGVDQQCFARSAYIELWLMHRSCVPDCTRSKKSLHPRVLVPTIPSLADQILRFAGFGWRFNNQCATLHHQHIASQQSRITAQGQSCHGMGRHPAVAHPQPTLQAEELYRRALTGSEDQLGAVRPDTLSSVWNLAKLLEYKGSFAEAGFGRLLLLLGPVLLGGDVKVGSWWKLKKWFNSDALLSLGKSVVKIRKMFSVYECFL